MILLAIDPGRDTGWARFDDQRLTLCGLTHPDDYRATFAPMRPDKVIIERPTIYPGARNGDDIVTLAARMGMIKAQFGCPIDEVEPRRWKHQTPKEIHNRRVIMQLAGNERALLPKGAKAHNVIDAVGLGLWALKRML